VGAERIVSIVERYLAEYRPLLQKMLNAVLPCEKRSTLLWKPAGPQHNNFPTVWTRFFDDTDVVCLSF
jgi:hypothetical protein